MLTSADSAEATLRALMDQAKRLGLAPGYRTGTVFAQTAINGRMMVLLDNDIFPTPCFNYAGPADVGTRVLTVAVPPHGIYVLGQSGPAPLSTVTNITGTGSWTPPAGLVSARVQLQAGGGGAGGAGITIASQWSFGDGGGGGEYAESVFTAAALGTAGITVTIGAGGIGGISSIAGSTGGTTSFALPAGTVTTIGGGGGASRPPTTSSNFSQNTQTRAGGSGGTGTAAIRIAGSPGSPGFAINSAAPGVRAGDGGSSFLAGGQVESLNGAAMAGQLYGGGGGGVANSASQGAALTGGAGAQGIVIVTSYFA